MVPLDIGDRVYCRENGRVGDIVSIEEMPEACTVQWRTPTNELSIVCSRMDPEHLMPVDETINTRPIQGSAKAVVERILDCLNHTPDHFEEEMKEIFSSSENVSEQTTEAIFLMCDYLDRCGFGAGIEIFQKESKL